MLKRLHKHNSSVQYQFHKISRNHGKLSKKPCKRKSKEEPKLLKTNSETLLPDTRSSWNKLRLNTESESWLGRELPLNSFMTETSAVTWTVYLSASQISTTDSRTSSKLTNTASKLAATALVVTSTTTMTYLLKSKIHFHYFGLTNKWYSNWKVTDFATDRDLYDKDGNQIYAYIGDTLYHRDLDRNGTWLDTWHVEQNQTHPYGYRSKENYFEELNNFTYMAAPSALYNIHQDCDAECSRDCLSLSLHHSLDIVDACNTQRCNCFYQDVDTNTCNKECKTSCLYTPGGR